MQVKINKETDAILIVDFQNDFITGSLAVPGAEQIIPVLKSWLEKFDRRYFSKDMHPEKHSSFVEQGGPWPPHCIAGEYGSKLHISLYDVEGVVVEKGTKLDKDAYSAFDGTDLLERLHLDNTHRLFVCGLATDYCVKATVMDALRKFNGPVFILCDAMAAVNVNPGDGVKAIADMLKKDAIGITVGDVED